MRSWLALLALSCGLGCNTPSVPLPPPILSALRFQSPGPNLVLLEGAPEPRHALVRFYVVNDGTGDGVITTAAADGSFSSTPFQGAEGDFVHLYYDTPLGERGQQACAELRLDAGLLSTLCP